MAKIVTIHQPDFIPYLGYFHRLSQSDLFIALDHVQFSKGGFHNRDKIKLPNGKPEWITIPVTFEGSHFPPINQVKISQAKDWRAAHFRQLEKCYDQAPFYDEIIEEVRALYANASDSFVNFSMASISWLMKKFCVEVPFVYSSSLDPQGKSNEMLVDLLKKVGATHYLSGTGARDYFQATPYTEAGIEVLWQEFQHPQYPQLHGEFLSMLSSLDFLFNCGSKAASELFPRQQAKRPGTS